MKQILIPTLVTLTLVIPALAHDDHDHEAKKSGPNGGRVLTHMEPHAEFFVTSDRKVQITFLGEDGKAIAPEKQIVVVTTGDRSQPTKLSFVKSGNVLLSETALPAGDHLPTVIQIKATPDAKAVVEKFNLELTECLGCKRAEYACTCEHSH